MLFQIDFCRKIIITTLACLVTFRSHENNRHVFLKFLFCKNKNHKSNTYVTYHMNEQIEVVLTILSFENKVDYIYSSYAKFSLYELVQYALSN